MKNTLNKMKKDLENAKASSPKRFSQTKNNRKTPRVDVDREDYDFNIDDNNIR